MALRPRLSPGVPLSKGDGTPEIGEGYRGGQPLPWCRGSFPRSAWPQGLAPGGAVQSENDPPREAPEAERDQHRRRPTVE